jgi:signal transduction histidine kinase
VHVIHLQVMGLLDAAQRMESLPQAWAADRIGRLSTQVGRLGRLLDNLLDVSRITAGRLQLELENVDAATVVSDVVDRYRAPSQELKISVEPCPGEWDRLRLEQVVSNLVANAIKFGQRKPVEVRLECSERSVVLQVQDGGIGISPADQEHLFSRFGRGSSDRAYGGFGLGLWITREIVTAMGGTISVTSEIGRGALFNVSLPRTLTGASV